MICNSCQKKIEENSHFCPYCGAAISTPSAVEPPNIPVPPAVIDTPETPISEERIDATIPPSISEALEPSADPMKTIDSEWPIVPPPTEIIETPANILPLENVDQSHSKRSKIKNKPLLTVSIIFAALFLALAGVCAYFIVKGNESKELNEYYKEQITNYKEDANDYMDQIQSLNSENDSYQSQIIDLENQVTDLQFQANDYLSQANENLATAQDFQNQLDSLQLKINEFSNDSIMVKITSVYNGNINWNKISDDLTAESIQYLMFDYEIFSVDDISNYYGNELSVSIFGPDGVLLQGNESPYSSTAVQTINGSTNKEAWGNEAGGYYTPGMYVIQFEYDGKVVGLFAVYLY